MNDYNTSYHNYSTIIYEFVRFLQVFLQAQVAKCNQDLHSVIVPYEVACSSILNIVSTWKQ
jgi:hypothetical protein